MTHFCGRVSLRLTSPGIMRIMVFDTQPNEIIKARICCAFVQVGKLTILLLINTINIET